MSSCSQSGNRRHSPIGFSLTCRCVVLRAVVVVVNECKSVIGNAPGSADPAAAGLEGPRTGVAWDAETVAQSTGAASEQLGELGLRQQQAEAFRELCCQVTLRGCVFAFHGLSLFARLSGKIRKPHDAFVKQ